MASHALPTAETLAEDAEWTATARAAESLQVIQQIQRKPEQSLEDRRKLLAAEQGVNALAARFQKSLPVQRLGASAAMELGDYKTGIARAERAAGLAREQADPEALAGSLVTSAIGHGRLGDFPRAHAAALEALRLNPQGPYSHAAQDILRLTQERGARAGKAAGEDKRLREILAAASPLNDPRVRQAGLRATNRLRALELLSRSMNRLNLGDPKGALKTTEQAIALDPGLPDLHMQRAVAWMSLKNRDAALGELDKAIALWASKGGKGESLLAGYNTRSLLRWEARDYQGALEDSSQALGLKPESAQAFYNRARAREGLGGKAEQVLADFKRAAELDPRSFAADYEAALSRHESGPKPAAAPPTPKGSEVAWAAWALALGLSAIVGACLARRRKAQQIEASGG